MAFATQSARLTIRAQPYKEILDQLGRKIVNEVIPCIDLPELQVATEPSVPAHHQLAEDAR